ncbi:MAG: CotH kinase family protein [Bacteroidales bacterium]
MKKYILFVLVLPFISSGQPVFPEMGEVFNDDVVTRFDVFINPDTLEWIYNNVESNQEFHALMIFSNGSIVDTMENVGFRLRGNTSRYSAKKSFKLSFNTFESGRKWFGMEKINLNGEHNDPSIARSKLGWDLLREMDVPAPRANHTQVFINGNYYGLYICTEHIDEEFVDSRFGNQDGNLYKCLWPADLAYLGPDPDAYKYTIGERRAYDLKTNTEADDYSDIAQFIGVLNNSTSQQFICEMDDVFNIYDYLKVIAVDVFIGNWDGYIYNKNNFYLYRNTETGKFEYIPYDIDNTYGIDWLDRDWGTRDIYDWEQHGSEVRPLYSRIMDNQELKDQYSYYFDRLLTDLVDPAEYFQKIDNLRAMLEPFVANDPYYPLDYGYDLQDFNNSYEMALGGHVDYGIKPYVSTRRDNAMIQLQINDIQPVVKYILHNQPQAGGNLWVQAYVDDEDGSPDVRLVYTINDGIVEFSFMYDDGEHNDGDENDQIYGGFIPDIQMNSSIEYQVSAEDNFGYESLMPCEPVLVELVESEQNALFINEFMASNDSTIADEFGEYDDWIEIYNGDENAVWLGNKYLSDNLQNPDKWLMPDVMLDSGDFILIWADNDEEQGPTHTNFKLDQEGEEIGIFDSDATGFFLLDSITYGPQATDFSFGRDPDGGMIWQFYNPATPGLSNLLGAIGEDLQANDWVSIYPNPVSHGIVRFSRVLKNVVLYNQVGQIVLKKDVCIFLEVQDLKSGIYILSAEDGLHFKLVIQ